MAVRPVGAGGADGVEVLTVRLSISGEAVPEGAICMTLLPVLSGTLTPVSYTHLDVYKRQVQRNPRR